jgi:hypothetical protein
MHFDVVHVVFSLLNLLSQCLSTVLPKETNKSVEKSRREIQAQIKGPLLRNRAGNLALKVVKGPAVEKVKFEII